MPRINPRQIDLRCTSADELLSMYIGRAFDLEHEFYEEDDASDAMWKYLLKRREDMDNGCHGKVARKKKLH